MSSITKRWTEEDFRRELRKIDKHVRETQGIELSGAELEITFSERARCRLGYYSHVKRMFNFSLAFFNSDVPEASAIDVIRHEYAHYYNHVVNGQYGHGVYFKSACRIVGANPRTYYSYELEASAGKREKRAAMVYNSEIQVGQEVCHPVFGVGTVSKVSNKQDSAFLTVDFGKHGVKVIDEAWLRKKGVV